MSSQKLKIVNKLGLHARAAVKLVNLASRFQSEIILCYQNKKVNAKSIMNVMVLAAAYQTDIEIITTGEDEAEALSAVVELINNRFDETE